MNFSRSVLAIAVMGLVSPASFAAAPPPGVTPAQVKAAEKGDQGAIFRTGRAYLKAGQYDEAEKWLTRAAEKGYLPAQMELARLYFMTADGDKEKEEAGAKWTKRAADSGDANAQIALALLYQQGLGIEQDHRKALRIFEKLSQVGHPGAQYNLGVMHRDGLGVAKNDAKAAALLSLAVQGYKEGPARNQIAGELRELKGEMTQAELRQSKTIYEGTVTRFMALQRPGGESGDLARPELPSAEAVQPKEKKRRKAYDLSGFVQGGVRWQSNANSAPPLKAANERPRPDHNLFVMGSARLLSPSPWKGSAKVQSLDTRLVLYRTLQHDRSISDITFAELSSGPNIDITPDGKYTVRPYLTMNTIRVDNDLYQVAGGGGVNLVAEVTQDTTFIANAEEIYINFDQAAPFPDNNQSDGTQFVLSARGIKKVTSAFSVDLGATWRNVEARKEWRSQDSFRFANGYSLKLPVLNPEWSTRNASLYTSAAYKYTWFEAPEAAVVPGIRRSNAEWQWTLTGEFPVKGDWSLVPTVQRTVRTGNHPLYETTNSMGSVAAMYKF